MMKTKTKLKLKNKSKRKSHWCIASDLPHVGSGVERRAPAVSWSEVVKGIPNQELLVPYWWFALLHRVVCFLFVCRASGVCSVLFPWSLVVSTSAIDCLERLISEMTRYMSSGTLHPAHSVTHFSHAGRLGVF